MKKYLIDLLKQIKKRAISLTLLLFSGIFIFLSGFSIESTNCQNCAEYIANVSKKEKCSPVVSIYDETKTTARLFSDHYYGFDVFHSGHNVFAGYNAGKTKQSSLLYDGQNIVCDLTLVTTRGLDIEKNKEGKYRNTYYDFDLMFPSIGKTEGYSTSCFITKSQADKLLALSSKASYEDLIGLKLIYECDDREPIELTIFNIILEEGKEFNRFNNNFGNFFVANDWEFLRKPFLYMYYYMNDVAFENFQYLKMLKESFSNDKITGEILCMASSQKTTTQMNDLLRTFLNKEKKMEADSIIFLIFSILLLIGSTVLILNEYRNVCPLDGVLAMTIPLFPYVFFYLLYILSNDASLFSYFSTVGLLIIEVVLFVLICALSCLKLRNKYEIS